MRRNKDALKKAEDTRLFTMLIGPKDDARLDLLAEKLGVSKAQVVRTLLREAEACARCGRWVCSCQCGGA